MVSSADIPENRDEALAASERIRARTNTDTDNSSFPTYTGSCNGTHKAADHYSYSAVDTAIFDSDANNADLCSADVEAGNDRSSDANYADLCPADIEAGNDRSPDANNAAPGPADNKPDT